MNLPLKRIIDDIKLPLVVFLLTIIVMIIFFISALINSSGEGNGVGCELVNILYYCSVITAIISSFIKFSYILFPKQQKFYFQGKDNRVMKFFSPLLSEYIVFIIIDIFIMIVYLVFNVPGELHNIKDSYIVIDSFSTIALKYCIATAIFFLYHISIDVKSFILGIFVIVFSFEFTYRIFMESDISSIITIILLIVVSYIIYFFKYKRHNYEFLKMINYSFIITLVITIMWRNFIAKVYLDYNYTFSINDTTVNLIYFILLFLVVVGYTKRNSNKLFKKEYILLLYIVPLILGCATYNYSMSLNNDMDIPSDNKKSLQISINNQYRYSDNSSHLTIKKDQRAIYSSIKKEARYNINYDELEYLNIKFLKENNLVLLTFMQDDDYSSRSILIERTKFDKLLERRGYRNEVVYRTYNYDVEDNNPDVLIISLSKSTPAFQGWYKEWLNSYKSEGSKDKLINSEDIALQLNKLNYYYYDEYYETEDTYYYEINKFNIYVDDDGDYAGYISGTYVVTKKNKNITDDIIEKIKKEVKKDV